MSKAVYVGVISDVPTIKETIVEYEGLSQGNVSDYFSVELYSKGITYSESTNSGTAGLRFAAGNVKVNSSTGGGVFTALHDLKNVKVYCEYKTETYDKITTIVAGTTVMDGISGTDNTTLNLIWSGDLSAGQEIDCKFVKDESISTSNEKVYWEITCDPITIITTEIIGYETKPVARFVPKMYVGVNNIARKVKKGYIGVDGVARLFYSSVVFEYTGDYTEQDIVIGNSAYKLYTLTSSGTLTCIDSQYWMCGGGAGGANGYSGTGHDFGGGGGAGAFCASGDLMGGKYAVTIGAGGSAANAGAVTTLGDITVKGGGTGSSEYGGSNAGDGGSGGNGGTGGGGGVGSAGSSTVFQCVGGTGDGISKYPFGLTELSAHCAGGGGGSMTIENNGQRRGGAGGTNGSNGSAGTGNLSAPPAASGGTKGGGAGGINSTGAGGTATFYGSGGGGGASSYLTDKGSGGKGYQGVVYILIAA